MSPFFTVLLSGHERGWVRLPVPRQQVAFFSLFTFLLVLNSLKGEVKAKIKISPVVVFGVLSRMV